MLGQFRFYSAKKVAAKRIFQCCGKHISCLLFRTQPMVRMDYFFRSIF